MDDLTKLIENVPKDEKFRDQVSGVIIERVNSLRIADEIAKLGSQDANFSKAINQIDMVREFVGSPEHILGSQNTKHGEIAEHVEVGIRRAREALIGKNMTATFDGVGRTAPEDYLINGILVQSKFLNGINNNLSAVIEHMEKYSNFGRDGSFYNIPKDVYETIDKIQSSESINGLKFKTIEAIKNKISTIENESGKSFSEVVKPSISNYAEVQQGTIIKTLDQHNDDVSEQNAKIKDQIRQEHKPNLREAGEVTITATLVGAAISLTSAFYQKSKEGKKFYKGDFSNEDWKEIGVSTGKGAIKGGISGLSIYGLTNYASLSAPFAGAVVSASKGVGSLIKDFDEGTINQEEFIEIGMVICSESAIVGFATAAGQAAIPIPILGAVIGSIAGSMLVNSLGAKNKTTAHAIRREMEDYVKQLDLDYKNIVDDIIVKYNNLGDITKAAFDLDNNKHLLLSSIALAREYGVKDQNILKSPKDINKYFLS